ncbi:ArsR family transcriptional regulator [Pedobacter yulinensis]|uniref:ArsR family transcriptional regulator n=1 Tax=Pedobacter yulinensis TaxID=2126353 RepID=A0A2T3HJ10_9SPHI|nr:Lrp/AsnC family transcriptional regulator [Pedobacter yulinensis]PST82420.1 ArsR family transcriptional regulator [Pedobacter yulinensis]
MQELDHHDKKLLSLLQQNNRLTAEELGEAVHLSASAVQRRLKRLRDDQVIQADVSIVSPLAAGMRIMCIVDIILQDGGSRELGKFKSAMRDCEEVMQCYFVTGTYDFVLVVNVRDMEHYEAFSTRWLMDNPNVKHFYTHVVMDRVKTGYNLKL